MAYLHVYTNKENSKSFSKHIILNNLSDYLGIEPSSIIITHNDNGKPFVDGINFSISHCKHVVVQVFSQSEYIGVDVEYINHNRNYLKLAERYFHKTESRCLHNLSKTESIKMFYNLWTAKESVCKAEGGRLWYYLADNYLTNDNKMKTVIKGLKILNLNTIPNFALTVAVSEDSKDMEIVCEK